MSELEPRPAGNGADAPGDPTGPLEAIDHDTLTGRVLVVDDTPFNRQLLRRLLDRIGHETLEAGDGQAALDLLRDPATEPVDVILLDIMMPVMDGYEFRRWA
jgi:CheY-like chemotaxis protein